MSAARKIVIDERYAGTMSSLISQDELDRITPKKDEPGYVDPNPCVRIYGKAPEGIKCKDCKHLTRLEYGRTVLKCDLRGDLTHGSKTDQKANWNACKRFEEGENRKVWMR